MKRNLLWIPCGLFILGLLYGGLFARACPFPSTQLYYLGGFAQTSSFTPLTTAQHGKLGVACRTGWRIIQPTSGASVWTSIDACQAAAQANSTKWSLSIKIGADVPLWLFNSTCTATTQAGETGPGGGSLNAETFTWNQSFEYTNGSTQCVPVPWEANFQAAMQTFVSAVGARYGNDPLLDHVVVTGLNSITQENLQPATSNDLTQWANYLNTDGQTCTNAPTSCPQYNTAITGAYAAMINMWGNAFPSAVGLASMYVAQSSFPFNSNNLFAQGLMQQLIAYDSTRALPMNNAAQVNGGVAGFDASILTLVGSARIAYQELGAVGCPTNAVTLINGANTNRVNFLEIYPADLSCL